MESIVIRPKIPAPKLHRYQHLSVDAQSTMAALEEKYSRLLNAFHAQQTQSQSACIDSSSYYKSIYNANFKKIQQNESMQERNEAPSTNTIKASQRMFPRDLPKSSEDCSSKSFRGRSMQCHNVSKSARQKKETVETDVMLTYRPTDHEIEESILTLTQKTSAPDSPLMDFEEFQCGNHGSFESPKFKKSIDSEFQAPKSSCLTIHSPEINFSPISESQIPASVESVGTGVVSNMPENLITKFSMKEYDEFSISTKTLNNISSHIKTSNVQDHTKCPDKKIRVKKNVKSNKIIEYPINNQRYPIEDANKDKPVVSSPVTLTPLSFWCLKPSETLNNHEVDENPCPSQPTTQVSKHNSQPSVTDGNFDLNLSDFEFDSLDDAQNVHAEKDSCSTLKDIPEAVVEVPAKESVSGITSVNNKVDRSTLSDNEKKPVHNQQIRKTSDEESPFIVKQEIMSQQAVIKNHKSDSALKRKRHEQATLDMFVLGKCTGGQEAKVANIHEAKSIHESHAKSTAIQSSRKVDHTDLPKSKKLKSSFKPPIKSGSVSSSQAKKMNQEEVIEFGGLNEQQQRDVLSAFEESDCLVLTIIFSNGDTLCTTFYSAADHAKKRTAGWSDESVKHFIFLMDNKRFMISTDCIKTEIVKCSLLRCFSKPNMTKVICNCKEFLLVLMRILDLDKGTDINCCNIEDPCIAAWLLDPENQPLSFDQLCQAAGVQLPNGKCDWQGCLNVKASVMQKLKAKLKSRNQWQLFTEVEMALVPIIACMEAQPLNINVSIFSSFSNILKSKLSRLEEKIYKEAGHAFTINSHMQLRQVLYEELCLDQKLPANAKIGKTSVSHVKSTSEASLNVLVDVHPLPALILEYRQLQKLKSTYVDGMMTCVSNGKLSTHWDQTAAATGRLTSSQPNIQAVPKSAIAISDYETNYVIGSSNTSKAIINVREPFISSKGYILLAADFQQIELRVLAHLSEDSNLLSTFWKPGADDVFIALTSKWQNKATDSVTFADREQTKRVVYSVMYGVGKDKLAEYLKIKPDVAKSIMSSFLLEFPAIDRFTKKCSDFAKEFGYTETLCGRRRYFPHINSPSPVLRAQAQRQAVNFCVQGSAADICKLAMIAVDKALKKQGHLDCRMLLQIHDEMIWEIREDHLPQVKAVIQQTMENTNTICGRLCKLQVPLLVSLSTGKSWAELSSSQPSNEENSESTGASKDIVPIGNEP